jgi:hypothetical protein
VLVVVLDHLPDIDRPGLGDERTRHWLVLDEYIVRHKGDDVRVVNLLQERELPQGDPALPLTRSRVLDAHLVRVRVPDAGVDAALRPAAQQGLVTLWTRISAD